MAPGLAKAWGTSFFSDVDSASISACTAAVRLGRTAAQKADDAGLGLKAQLLEIFGDLGAGAELVKAELGVAMKVAPVGSDVG